MMRQVGDGVTVVGGEYPLKKSIKVTALDMEQMGNTPHLSWQEMKKDRQELYQD